MTIATTPKRLRATKSLAFFGALAVAVALGTLMVASLLVTLGAGDFKNVAGDALSNTFLQAATTDAVIAAACAAAGAAALLVAAALYAYGRLRPRV